MQQFIAATSYNGSTDVYPWTSGSGFGARFSDPTVAFGGQRSSINFNSTATTIAVSRSNAPGVSVYPFTYGFGTKYSDPAYTVTATSVVRFTPSSDAIFGSPGVSPNIIAWGWSVSGFGTKYADPASPLSATGQSCIAPNGNYIAAAQYNTRYMAAYPWSASGFGTRFPNSSLLALSSIQGDIQFASTSDAVAVAHSRSPYITVKGFSASGFGSNFANPTNLPSAGTGGYAQSVRFSPDGNYISVTGANSPFLYTYGWSASGFGTQVANPSVLATAVGAPGSTCDWSYNSSDVAYYLNTTTAPGPLIAYPFSAGYGAQYSAPTTRPTFVINNQAEVAFGVQLTASYLPATPLAVSVANPSANLNITRVLTASATSYATAVSNSNFIYRSILSSAEYLSYTSGNNLIEVYNWNSGFGTRTQQSVGPVIYGQFTSDAQYIATTGSTSPCIRVYPFTTTFGTQFADPAAPGTAGYSLQWTSNLNAILTTSNISPYLHAWAWSPTGFGSKFSNPATIPTTTTIKSSIAPSDKFIVYADWTSLFATAYKWSASGFGTKYTNSSSFGTSAICRSVAVGPNSDVVAVGHNRTPYVSLFPFDETNGFGVRFPSPSVLPGSGTTGVGWAVKFSNSGAYLTAGTNQSPYVHVYPWTTTGLGTKIANPSLLPNSTADDCTWSADDSNIAYAIQSITTPSPLIVYPFTTTFGTRYSAPLVRPNWSSSGAVSFGKQIVYNYPFAATTASTTVSTTSTTFNVTRINSSTVTDFNITARDATLTKTGVAVNYTLTATAGAYAETGQTATLSQTLATLTNYTLTAAAGSFSLTGISATLKATRKLTATLQTYVLTGTATGLAFGHKLGATVQSYSITGTTTGLTATRKLTASLQTYALTASTTTLKSTRNISAALATYSITSYTTNLIDARKITATVQSYSVISTTTNLSTTRLLTATAQSYAVSSVNNSLLYGHLLSTTVNTYATTVSTATLTTTRLCTTAVQTFLVTGITVSLSTTGKLTANVQTYEANGTTTNLTVARKTTAGTQTFTLTSINSQLIFGHKLSADIQTFYLTPIESQLLLGLKLLADVQTYTFNASDSQTLYAHRLTAAAQTYPIIGSTTNLPATRLLTTSAQTYAFTGTDSQLLYGHKLIATSSVFNTISTDALLVRGLKLTALTQTYALTHNDAALSALRLIYATVKTYSITSINATLSQTINGTNYTLTATAGSYSETGQTATLTNTLATVNNYTLSATVRSYQVTVITANLKISRTISATNTTYTISSIIALLKTTRRLSASVMAASLSSINVVLKTARIALIDVTTFAVNGVSSSTNVGYKLQASVQNYLLTAQDAVLKVRLQLSAITTSYTVETTSTSIVSSRIISTSMTACPVTTPSATLRLGVSLAGISTSYAYQGYDSDFILSRNITVTTAHFSVDPSVANVTYQRTFITSTLAVSVTQNAVSLLSNKTIIALPSVLNCTTSKALIVANRAQAIEFHGLKAKGVGSFIPPVSNQIDLADVRFINRRTLVNLYGWGVVDRTLPFDWSENNDVSCPQLGPIDFLHSIYDDVTYNNNNVRWLTRSPGCLEVTTAAADALSDDAPIIVPIVHAISDIEKLKSERRTLEAASIEPAALPPAIASNYDINISVIEQTSGTEGSILIIDSNIKPVTEPPVPVVAAPMPTVAQSIEITEPQIPALKANHIQLNLNRHYRSDKPSDLAVQNNVIVNPIVVPPVNNAMPVIKPKPPDAPHVNSPVIKNNFNIGHGRPKRKH